MVSVCKNPIDELGKAETPGICGVHRRGRKKFTWTVIASQRLVRTSRVLRRAGAGLFLARNRIAETAGVVQWQNRRFPRFGPEFDCLLVCTNCARIRRFQSIRVVFERKADSPTRWKR